MAEPTASPPVPLERYASMHAEVEACGELDPILERERLSKEQWLAAQVYWMRRMADEAQRKRFETTNRYNAVFTAKRKVFEARVARERVKKAQPLIVPPDVSVLAAADAQLAAPLRSSPAPIEVPPPPAVAPITAREPGAVGGAPPFGRAMPSAGAAALGAGPAAPPAGPRQSPSSPGFVAPPAHVPVPAPAPAQVPAPAPAPAARTYGTMAIPLDQIVPPTATPFKGTSPAPPPSPPASEPGSRAPTTAPAVAQGAARSLGSTWTSTPQDEHALREAMPFKPQGGASPPPTTTGPLPPTSIPVSASETAPIDVPADMRQRLREQLQGKQPALNATLGPDALSSFAQAGALPFDRRAPVAPPPPSSRGAAPPPDDDDDDNPRTKMVDPGAVAAAVGKATPFASKPEAPAAAQARSDTEVAPRTVSFDGTGAAAAAREALPFPGQPPGVSASPKPKRFSINVFASLTAEIAENPGEAEAIRARYGVSEAEHHEESRRWTDDFTKSEEARQRYLGIVQRYRGYIQARKRT